MSEREHYEHGTPSWVDHSSPDAEGAAHFYGPLFGWEAEDQMPPGQSGQYFMCRLRGRDVAAPGTQQAPGVPPTWNTYITVDDAGASAAAIREAGGTVLGEPFDVFDAGRMALAVDPEGAPFCIWQAARMPGAGLVNEPGALCWTELTSGDPEGAKAFYGRVFGWRAAPMGPGDPYLLWYAAGDGDPSGDERPIGGLMPAEGEGPPPSWSVCFAVEDTDATAAQARDLGGAVTMAPFDTPVGRTAVLADPQGADFAVIALVNPDDA
jgi:predicted enzyme related to lactoylglutathione lyase